MSIKIQINSLAALERLIGGDSELEIQIRNSIVQEFSKKYLKSIAMNYFENGLKKTQSMVDAEVRMRLVGHTFPYKTKITDEIAAKIHDLVEKELRCLVSEQARKSMEEWGHDMVSDVIKYAIERNIDIEVKKRVSEKLKKAEDAIRE